MAGRRKKGVGIEKNGRNKSRKSGLALDDIMDWNDDSAYDAMEDDDMYDEIEDDAGYEAGFGGDWKPYVNKKLMLGVGALSICILLGAVTVFVLHVKNAKSDREAALLQIETSGTVDGAEQAADNQDKSHLQTAGNQEGTDEAAGSAGADGEGTDAQAVNGQDGKGQTKQGETTDTVNGIQEEVSVGALDDEQDPQGSGAAGNEESGAQVTIAKTNEDETADTTLGIDVSKYQGTIDWEKVKAAGVDFAMIRVGYRAKATGEIFEDPTARYNMQEAQAAGVKIGAYFFSSAVTKEEAQAEAAFTKDIIAKYKITYPVAFNCEDFQSPDSRQYGLDASARTALACAFLDEIAAAGYTPMFYASKGELEGSAQWDSQTLASKYKMWVAQYPEKPYPETNASTYSGAHDMWQYTSQGTVDGIIRKTDVNIAYFGYSQEAEAKDETPAEIVEADPEVGIQFTEVNETVTAKQETNLRSEPSTLNDDSIVAKLIHGDTAVRTGIGHNGWSRVIYNGQTLYAVSSYLTTDMEDTGQQAPPQGPVYTPVNEQVTAKMETNLRSEPGTASDDTIVGLLHNGEVLTRTAVGDNGWSKLDYNGQTVYAVTSYLTVVQ